jgi:hypothetical protein
MVFPVGKQFRVARNPRRFVKGEFGCAQRESNVTRLGRVEAGHFAGQLVHRLDKLLRAALSEDTVVNIFPTNLRAYVRVAAPGRTSEGIAGMSCAMSVPSSRNSKKSTRDEAR